MLQPKITWKDGRAHVSKVNPSLAKIIDDLSPDDKLSLELRHFHYGEEIASPDNARSFLVLQKSCETFFEYEGKPKTYDILKPGEMGLAGALFGQSTPLCQSQDWKITAGGRSVFMLPKISDKELHRKMEKAHNFSATKPDEPHMQWNVFKELAYAARENSDWICQVLFFDDAWRAHASDPAWARFHSFLFNQSQQHQGSYEQMTLLKMAIGMAQKERKVNFTLHQTEGLLYLFSLGLGTTPGFKVSQDEELLPLQLIQHSYFEHYGLKEYAPLILTPDYLDWKNQDEMPLYTSFNNPTSYFLSPKTNKRLSNAKELNQLIGCLKKVRDFILNKKFISEASPLYQLMLACDFTFYHKNYEGYSPRLTSPDLLSQQNSAHMQKWHQSNRTFPIHSSFWQGCASIRPLQKPV